MIGRRGYNAVELPKELPWPDSLQPEWGSDLLTYDQLMANLVQAGVNLLRVKLCGDNSRDAAFEYRLGQFNTWNGRLDEMVEAARAHGIGFQVIPFDSVEFLRGWASHPWNSANGGMISDAVQAFTNYEAMEAAYRRIDAIVDALGETIVAWELVAEMGSNLCTPEFLGTGWDDQYTQRINDWLCTWVDAATSYIHAIHSAPVGNGQIFADKGLGRFPGNVRNEPFRVASLDFALINWYGTDPAEQLAWLRACQEYTQLPVRAEQYAPWVPSQPADYDGPEPPPFARSKVREWMAVCGEYGAVGPLRWIELRPRYDGTPQAERQWYGIASPQMAEIAGVTRRFAEGVDFDDWDGGQSWDEMIETEPDALVSSFGDGQHVYGFVRTELAGPKTITVYGLETGLYTIQTFDWLSGDPVSTISAEVMGNTVTFITSESAEAVFYLYPKDNGGQPEPPTGPVWRFIVDGEEVVPERVTVTLEV